MRFSWPHHSCQVASYKWLRINNSCNLASILVKQLVIIRVRHCFYNECLSSRYTSSFYPGFELVPSCAALHPCSPSGGDCVIFCHAPSERVRRVWSAVRRILSETPRHSCVGIKLGVRGMERTYRQ